VRSRQRPQSTSRDPLANVAYAARVYRQVARSGWRLEGMGPQADRVAAARLRQLVRLVEAGGRPPVQALTPGWRTVLEAERLVVVTSR
jgi:hypothetical protein